MTAPDLAKSKKDDLGRFYTHPIKGHDAPSITNVTSMKDKGGIAPWGYRKCGEFVADNLDTLVGLKKDRSAVVDLVRGAPWRSTSNSGERGDVVHEWAERWIKSGGLEPSAEEIASDTYMMNDKPVKINFGTRGMWKQFLAITNQYEFEWVLSETTVWSDKHDYAGTLDWMARINGILTLGDFKTGNNVYPEVAMQLAAAHHADYAFDGSGNQIELPRAERFAVMHIRPRFARLHPVLLIDEAFESFLGLRACFEWDKKHAENTIRYTPKIEAK